MINLLASGLISLCLVSPVQSTDCAGDIVVPTPTPTASVSLPDPLPPILPALPLPLPDLPVVNDPLPPVVVPSIPPLLPDPVVITLPPVLPPAPALPPVVPAPTPAPAPVPPPAHVVKVPVAPVAGPAPAPEPAPVAVVPDAPTATTPTVEPPIALGPEVRGATESRSASLLRDLGTVTESAIDPTPEETTSSTHHPAPFDDSSIGGIIGNTLFRFPDLGWLALILAGIGLIILNEKLDEKPGIRKVGRHSSKRN